MFDIDLDFEALRRIGFSHSLLAQLSATSSDLRLARVVEVQRDRVTIHDGRQQALARSDPASSPSLTVGDWVLLRDGRAPLWIVAALDPLNRIVRRTREARRQPLVSNVDTALLVMGLDHDFNPRRLERYLALVQTAGVAPVVVLTKADIGHAVDARVDQLRQRLPSRIPVVPVNGHAPDCAEALAPWLGAGQTVVLLGSSGAGKSTLTNTLCGVDQATGAVRVADGHGRHTTTARSLHQCAAGACIIDTPGLRALQPDADADTLAATFDDIEALAAACQFRDCRHGAEPGCAVRDAVDPDRLRNFHKLLREARRGEQSPVERIAERGKWKVVVRAHRRG